MSRERLSIAGLIGVVWSAWAAPANGASWCLGQELGPCLDAATYASAPRETGSGQSFLGSSARFGMDARRGVQVPEARGYARGAPDFGRVLLAGLGLGLRMDAGLGSDLRAPGVRAVVAHLSYPLSDSFSIDLAAAQGKTEHAAGRPDSFATPAPFGEQFGYASERTQWAVALNAASRFGAFGIGGRIGYLGTRDQSGTYGNSGAALAAERDITLRQSFLGIDASYGISRNWQLRGGAMFRRDASPGASVSSVAPSWSDREGREWGIGVRYYGWRNFRLNVEFLKSSGRDQFGSESLTFTGRFAF